MPHQSDKIKQLHQAAILGDFATIITLIEEESVDVDAVDEHGRTALHLACETNQDEIAQYFCDKGANKEHFDSNGLTALHKAAIFDCPDALSVLLHNNVDPNIQGSQDGSTPLHWAVKMGSLTVVTILCGRKDIDGDIKNNEGQLPFHLVAENIPIEVLQSVMQNGPQEDYDDYEVEKAIDILIHLSSLEPDFEREDDSFRTIYTIAAEYSQILKNCQSLKCDEELECYRTRIAGYVACASIKELFDAFNIFHKNTMHSPLFAKIIRTILLNKEVYDGVFRACLGILALLGENLNELDFPPELVKDFDDSYFYSDDVKQYLKDNIFKGSQEEFDNLIEQKEKEINNWVMKCKSSLILDYDSQSLVDLDGLATASREQDIYLEYASSFTNERISEKVITSTREKAINILIKLQSEFYRKRDLSAISDKVVDRGQVIESIQSVNDTACSEDEQLCDLLIRSTGVTLDDIERNRINIIEPMKKTVLKWYDNEERSFFEDYNRFIREWLFTDSSIKQGIIVLKGKDEKRKYVFDKNILWEYLGSSEFISDNLREVIKSKIRKYPFNHVETILGHIISLYNVKVLREQEEAKEQRKKQVLQEKIQEKLSEYFKLNAYVDVSFELDSLYKHLADYNGTYMSFFKKYDDLLKQSVEDLKKLTQDDLLRLYNNMLYNDYVKEYGDFDVMAGPLGPLETSELPESPKYKTLEDFELDKKIIDLITVCKFKMQAKTTNQTIEDVAMSEGYGAVISSKQSLQAKLRLIKLFVENVAGLKKQDAKSAESLLGYLDIEKQDTAESETLSRVTSFRSPFFEGTVGPFTNITKEQDQDEHVGLERQWDEMQVELNKLFSGLGLTPEGIEFNIPGVFLRKYFGEDYVQATSDESDEQEKLYLLSECFESDFLRRVRNGKPQLVEQKSESKPNMTYADTIFREGVLFIKIKFVLQEALRLAQQDNDYTLLNSIRVMTKRKTTVDGFLKDLSLQIKLSIEQLEKLCGLFSSIRLFKTRFGQAQASITEADKEQIILRTELLEVLSKDVFSNHQRVKFTCGHEREFAEDDIKHQLSYRNDIQKRCKREAETRQSVVSPVIHSSMRDLMGGRDLTIQNGVVASAAATQRM